jgi:branched-chain amino acid transport system ATP-binding protein
VAILAVENLTKHFGGLTAVFELSFSIERGEILGLIGPNGAGKTTVFNLITGVFPPSRGQVRFANEDITGWKPYEINKRGIARIFQSTRHFPNFTVLDNLITGRHCRTRAGLWSSLFKTRLDRQERRDNADRSAEILEFLDLASYRDELAKNIPQAMQRRLDIGIALATEPDLLLLDEPAAGMNPEETYQLMEIIRKIRERKISVFLIEHDMQVIMDVCERILVLNYGKKIAEGEPEAIQNNSEVIEAYLGSEDFDRVRIE